MSLLRAIAIVVLIPILVIAFQNCGQVSSAENADASATPEAAQYTPPDSTSFLISETE